MLKSRGLDTDVLCRIQVFAVDSFMHLHLGIWAEGLEHLTGHHVVVHNGGQDITESGNTCMISIPSVWDAGLAPSGHHVVHAYTLEPYSSWQRGDGYEEQKTERSQPLFRALKSVIPDIRQRIVLELIGTPLTHAHYLRRYQGTYGPAIPVGHKVRFQDRTPPFLAYIASVTPPCLGLASQLLLPLVSCALILW